jgi:sugar lactone lactonase YvrE
MGESPRWHDGRLWLCDWVAGEVVVADGDGGAREVVLRMPSFPFCIDWLPDGRLLVISGREARVLRREPDGELVIHADLSPVSDRPWIVAESYGRCLTAFEIEPDGGLSGRRTWADLGDGVPDGVSLAGDGTLWYADVPSARSTAELAHPGTSGRSRIERHASTKVLHRLEDLGYVKIVLGSGVA